MDRMTEENCPPLEVELITAVPLTEEQTIDIYRRLVRFAKRQIHFVPRVDTSLIAGVRIISEGMVLDTSVKQQLQEMKKQIYKGVYALE